MSTKNKKLHEIVTPENYFESASKFRESKLISANKVAQHLDITVTTLTNWYRWYNDKTVKKPDNVPPLPPYYQFHIRGVRKWAEVDLPLLEAFHKWVPKGRAGAMGAVSSRFWGKRGKKHLQKP